MAVTYNFTKITGGGNITGSDNVLNENILSNNVGIDVTGLYLTINVPGIFSKSFLLADIGTINGSAPPGTLAAIATSLAGTVFPKAASSGTDLTAIPDSALPGVTYAVTIKNGSWDFQQNP